MSDYFDEQCERNEYEERMKDKKKNDEDFNKGGFSNNFLSSKLDSPKVENERRFTEIGPSKDQENNFIRNTLLGKKSEDPISCSLPNGFTRKDYLDVGWSESDIELWGLDQPAAPDPFSAGLVIPDMLDGDLDGNFHDPFWI